MVSNGGNRVLRQLSLAAIMKTIFVMVCNEENRVLRKLSVMNNDF